MEWKGRGLLCQMLALWPVQHGALWWAIFTTLESNRAAQMVAQREKAPGPYSLVMAKGFFTLILPQSEIVTSFRGSSHLSVLVLSTFHTTSMSSRTLPNTVCLLSSHLGTTGVYRLPLTKKLARILGKSRVLGGGETWWKVYQSRMSHRKSSQMVEEFTG